MGKKSKRRPGRQKRSQQQQQEEEEHEAFPVIARPDLDRFMESFNLSSSLYDNPWNEQRLDAFFAFSKCFSVATGQHDENKIELGTEADRKFIKNARSRRTKPQFLRAEALWLSGWTIYTTEQQWMWDEAQDYFDEAIAVCHSIADEEKEKTVVLMGQSWKVLDYAKEIERKCKVFQAVHARFSYQAWDDDGRTREVHLVGGLECDGCGTDREELGLATLKVCGFCKMAFYCSRKCQTEAWSEHKKFCRKDGEFRGGDTAYITESVEMHFLDPDENDDIEWTMNERGERVRTLQTIGTFEAGTSVNVVGPSPSDSDDFFINSKDVENGMAIVPARLLRRCRPALWRSLTSDDLEWIREQVLARDAEAGRGGSDVDDGPNDDPGPDPPELVDRFDPEEDDNEDDNSS